jgi:hypothetical protein
METNYGKRVTLILVVLIAIAGVIFWALIGPDSFKASSKSETNIPKSQTERRITRKQFQQIRKDMLYSVIVRILGFEGERVSETRLDNFKTFVTYRWTNPDGSMVVIGFRRLDSTGGSNVMFADSISSVELTE